MNLIRRQDVMDVVSCYIDLCNKALDSLSLGGRDRYAIETERNSLLHLKDDMKSLPSAQPERKKGKWIDKSGGIEGAWNYCSVCGEQAIDLYDFCPNCGADMRGEHDGR